MINKSLGIFVCVAKNLNFTKAAEELYTTQPTISREIRILEKEVGVLLFTRNTKDVRLTDSGLVFLEQVLKWKNEWNETLQRARDIENGVVGTLRIGCLEAMDLSNNAFNSIYELEEKHPNVNVYIEKCSFSELRKKFDSGFFDVIITLNFEKNYLLDVEYKELEELAVGFLISKNHPLFCKENINIEDFNNISFLLPNVDDSPGREEELKEVFQQLKIKNNAIQFVDSLETMLLRVRSGRGAALVGEECEYVNDYKNFRFIQLPQLLGNLKIMTVWHKENLNPLVALYTNKLW